MCPWSVGPELSILKLNTTDFEIKRPRGFGDLLVPDRTLPQFAVKEADFFSFTNNEFACPEIYQRCYIHILKFHVNYTHFPIK